IAKLSGLLDSVGTDHCIVDCGGVGYLVFCSARTLRRVGDAGTAVSLRIEMQVREDAITLFGFIDLSERDWFRRLTTVQGVGSRVALALLSVLEPDKLGQAIAAQDRTALVQADGVGPKLANRLISELKDKVADLYMGGGPVAAGSAGVATSGAAGVTNDAVSALVNLGYRRAEAFTAVAAAVQKAGPDAKVEQLIMIGLKELSA
ncbi:MAG: ruvA, partial [Ramlibacter sp.]|nr:ruvA [Ramlibacter sp.]